MERDICEKMCAEFKVSENNCREIEKYYDTVILPKIKTKYLSHLVASIEELINRKMLEDNKKKLENIDEALKSVRRYSILLVPGNGVGKAKTYSSRFGAAVYYNPKNETTDLRILIAHELGHVVSEHRGKTSSDNFSNVFAFLAINGKDKFYKTKAPTFQFESEVEIISNISALCPILTEDQTDISRKK
ncbi:hypothetical protein FACS1894190_16040 [Spirochaetia bacterium]|nr:hypothetical protein FACS1894190_16040 [Spirochaetia bacterium]